MKYAVNAIKRFAQSTTAWKSFIIGPYGPFVNTTTDAELEFYIRNNSDTCVFQLPTSARELMSEYTLQLVARLRNRRHVSRWRIVGRSRS
jgi:hypothetical protein